MKQTPLHSKHLKLGASMANFSSFNMPIHYGQVKEECLAVRKAVGVFDVSHMGNILVTGSKALYFLEKIVVSSLLNLKSLETKYTAMCNFDGGVIDDLVVTLLGENAYHLVVNASNTETVYQWMETHLIKDVTLKNQTEKLGILALQGPKAIELAQKVITRNLGHLNRFYSRSSTVDQNLMVYSRTGYTGEDGLEFYPNANKTSELWDLLLETGQDYGIKPVGLAARDVLRLEAGYSLYGHELTTDNHILESGLKWLVDLDKKEFIGKESIQDKIKQGVSQKIVGIQTFKKAVPRAGDVLYWNEEVCGVLTSGTFSFTFERGIGMVRLSQKYTSYKEGFSLMTRHKKVPVELCSRYFYKR